MIGLMGLKKRWRNSSIIEPFTERNGKMWPREEPRGGIFPGTFVAIQSVSSLALFVFIGNHLWFLISIVATPLRRISVSCSLLAVNWL